MSLIDELHDAFQCRDALQLLCDKGYELQDMLAMCNKDIEILVSKQWTEHQGGPQ